MGGSFGGKAKGPKRLSEITETDPYNYSNSCRGLINVVNKTNQPTIRAHKTFFPFILFALKNSPEIVGQSIPFDIVRYIVVMLRNIVDLKYEVTTIFHPKIFDSSINPNNVLGPYGVFVDYNTGDIVYSEFHTHCVRKISPDGKLSCVAGIHNKQGSHDGKLGTGTLYSPAGICQDLNGDILITDFNNNLLRRLVAKDGILKTIKTGSYNLKMPSGICVDIDGTIVFNDCHNHNVKRIDKENNVTIIAGSTTNKSGFKDGKGTNASFYHNAGICRDSVGNFYITDHWNHSIRKLSHDDIVTTIAGDGTAGYADGFKENAKFNCPQGIGFYRGDLIVADMSNHLIRKVTLDGEVTTIAGTPNDFGPLDGLETNKFYHPIGVFIEKDGCVLITDASNNSLRRLTPLWAS